MRMDGCRHPLQLSKAAGICTPLGTWLCLPLVWQHNLSLSSEKPLGYTGATAFREQQNQDKELIQHKNNAISSKGGREDREEKHDL